MNVLTATMEFFGIRDSRELVVREEPYHDPAAVGHVMIRGINHIDAMVIARLEDDKRLAREAVDRYCQEIDAHIYRLQELSAPVQESIRDYTARLSFVTDALVKARTE